RRQRQGAGRGGLDGRLTELAGDGDRELPVRRRRTTGRAAAVGVRATRRDTDQHGGGGEGDADPAQSLVDPHRFTSAVEHFVGPSVGSPFPASWISVSWRVAASSPIDPAVKIDSASITYPAARSPPRIRITEMLSHPSSSRSSSTPTCSTPV